MEDKKIDKITILAKLCVICDMQVKLLEDKKKLEEELEKMEEDERKSNHN
tara:strand:+ start:1091 stop:1240 length:150 start_codon:yes stop_codon:yes gene_type:complete